MRLESPVFLFAAGFGTRMAPLTDNLPKPLIEVAGKPLIGHALDIVRAAGPRQIVANTHYLANVLEPWLLREGIVPVYEPEILETGGGLRNALPTLAGDPVITMNTDAVWRGANPLLSLLEAWRPDRMEALLLVVPTARAAGHVGKGDFALTPDGQLIRAADFVYSGLQIIKTGRLASVPEAAFSLNVIWDQMAKAGGLFGLAYDGNWCDVGRPESVPTAESMLSGVDV